MKNNTTRGIVMMIMAVAALTTMSMMVKVIGSDYHPAQVSFLRNLVAAAVILPFLLRAGGFGILKTRRPGMHIVRGLFGLAGNLLFFYAFQRMPVGDVVVISQAVPLFVTALAVFFLGERVGPRRWAAVSVGFVGVVISTDPTGAFQSTALLAVVATALWACTILMIRNLGATESPFTIAFYFMVTGAIVTAAFQPFVWRTPTTEVLLLLLGVGVTGAAGQMLMSYALKLAEASVVSPFNYTGILWGIGFDVILWDVAPTWTTLTGAAVITAAGLYIFRREATVRKAAKLG